MSEAGLGSGGLLYDQLQRIGIPIAPLSYCSFFLNFVIGFVYFSAMMGVFYVIYVLIAARSFDVSSALAAILQTPEFWIANIVFGLGAGSISVYRRWKYDLTKWDVI